MKTHEPVSNPRLHEQKYTGKKHGAETVFTQKTLVNITINYKEMASNTLIKTEMAFFF